MVYLTSHEESYLPFTTKVNTIFSDHTACTLFPPNNVWVSGFSHVLSAQIDSFFLQHFCLLTLIHPLVLHVCIITSMMLPFTSLPHAATYLILCLSCINETCGAPPRNCKLDLGFSY